MTHEDALAILQALQGIEAGLIFLGGVALYFVLRSIFRLQ